jgi:hypothetical protein
VSAKQPESADKTTSVYALKVMVVARLCAEVTVLLLLLSSPAILFFSGQFEKAALTIKLVCLGLSAVAAVVLPCYGFITYKVKADNLMLTACSLFRQQSLLWDSLKSMRLRNSWGWRRYVVTGQSGELTIPVWLEKQKELVDLIRSRLPGGGRTTSGGSTSYSQHWVTIVFQLFRVTGNLLFLAVFWMFAVSLNKHGHHGDATDYYIILGACTLFSVFMAGRCLLIMLTPQTVAVGDEGITLSLIGFNLKVAWDKIRKVIPADFPLPEGLIVVGIRRWYFIGGDLDGMDELADQLLSKTQR